ncbi:phage tail protein [Microbacterium sp. G2-8]|uniref:phage tail protein n=1 Tax=Microbacterium sp. G2-8 TaxID=2842454 RepID=UPI001C8991E9|nr:phage tail protein [Microbacterium sp. G2-8]
MSRDFDVHISRAIPERPSLSFKLIGTDKLSGGVGGWQEVPRQLREPLLVWTEQPLRVYTLPLRFDRFLPNWEYTVEGEIRALQDWASAGRASYQEYAPPTLVRVSGNVRVPLSITWAITELDWGEFVTNDRGERIRQDVTVTLKERAYAHEKGYADALRQALGE